jgi:hypothetical protein
MWHSTTPGDHQRFIAAVIVFALLLAANIAFNWSDLMQLPGDVLRLGRRTLGRQRPVRVRYPRFVHRLSANRHKNARPQSSSARNVATVDAATQRRVLAALTDDNIGGVRLVASQRVH